MASLQLQRQNYRALGQSGRRFLLHVPTTAMFELDKAADSVLELLEETGAVSEQQVRGRFDGIFSPDEVCDSLSDFLALGIISAKRKDYEITPREIKHFPINTLVLTLTTGCNLGCTYCYREDLTPPRDAVVMEDATARRALDMLLRESTGHEQVNVVFFGGEPTMRFSSIHALVAYAEEEAEKLGKKVDFSLTTNASLLTDEMIAFFQSHRFGISVSMDGDEETHDRYRITIGGKGTHKQVSKNVRRLLAGCTSRPVGARVTLSGGNTDVVHIYRHLHDELGFSEVGFAPATASNDSPLGLDGVEMRAVLDAMKALGLEYTAAAKRGFRHGFSNMNQLMQDLFSGTRKALPCGAGVGLLAVSAEGQLALCHRFTGTSFPSFGDVNVGIAEKDLSAFLTEAQRLHPACQECSARSICAGGCYHEAYVREGSALSPTFSHCDFVREWLDFGIECFGEIMRANPGFFAVQNKAQELHGDQQ
ncbi:quinohemoprotein amine dehydrogenase maturation protein [Herminiimonas sp. CN]|uniref:quinohemoprotein amine dehydrogenase maturation protein n=1 Tax=Herminiimonas sp. CN TaxID=1349818 RepID=UPI0004734F8D|nr:quinohemoprotein amine dehydrogenase maturation protein [Herminiimonas sp. CN]